MRLRSLIVVGLTLGVVSPMTPAQERSSRQEERTLEVGTTGALQLEARQALGEARFGGVWTEWVDQKPHVKVGIVGTTAPSVAPAQRAETVVKDLAGKHRKPVKIVRVPHTMAAIEACNQWISSQAFGGGYGGVNKDAPLPMGSGIGRVDPGLGVVLSLPKNATQAQRDLATAAKTRCGGMLKIEPGHVLVKPLACNISACDPPLRSGPQMFSGKVCTVGPLVRGDEGEV